MRQTTCRAEARPPGRLGVVQGAPKVPVIPEDSLLLLLLDVRDLGLPKRGEDLPQRA